MTTNLPAQYNAARKALAAAVKYSEINKVRDVAMAIETLARLAKDPELAGDAVQLKLDATCKLGIKIIEDGKAGKLAKGTKGQLKTAGPGRGKKGKTGTVLKTAPVLEKTLASQGVNTNLAKQARALGRMYLESPKKYQAERTKMRRVASAVAGGVADIIKAMKAEKHAAKLAARAARESALAGKILALPDKRFGVILEDPEWNFETYSVAGTLATSAKDHYSTSVLDVIKSRDVASIAAKDCALFLWATQPMLDQAIDVMKARGFTYTSHVNWIKENKAATHNRKGTGYWFWNVHETLLVGTRGNIPAPAPGTQWPSVVYAPRGPHSEKPEIFYELIEAYFPNLPKIELNARKRRKGWDAWGFEAPPDAEAAE